MENNVQYEEQAACSIESLGPIQTTLKKSKENKASIKRKDVLLNEASGALKENMEEAVRLIKQGLLIQW